MFSLYLSSRYVFFSLGFASILSLFFFSSLPFASLAASAQHSNSIISVCVNRGWSSWRGLGEWRARGQGLLGGSDQTSKHRVKHSWLRGTASFKAPLYYILNPVVNHIYFLLLLHLFNEPFEGYWSLPCFTTVLQTPQEPQDSQLHENDSKTIIQSLNRPCLSNLCWKKKSYSIYAPPSLSLWLSFSFCSVFGEEKFNFKIITDPADLMKFVQHLRESNQKVSIFESGHRLSASI